MLSSRVSPIVSSVTDFQAQNSQEAPEEEEKIVDAEADEGDGDATEAKRRKNQEEEVMISQVLSTAFEFCFHCPGLSLGRKTSIEAERQQESQ